MMIKSVIYLMSFIFFMSFQQGLFGQTDAPADTLSLLEAIGYKDVVDANLETDLAFLMENRRSEEEVEGVFRFKTESGEELELKVDLTIRGRYRRMFSQVVPPLKLNFKKGELRESGLYDYDDMKLVTYFYPEKDKSHDVLIKEYLAYKLLNAISDFSYRVQLLKIEYRDINTGDKIKQWAFLIEDNAEFRARQAVENYEGDIFNIPKEQFDRDQVHMASIFQYMIGNSDWSLDQGKNIKLVIKDEKIRIVPFDFDFAGLVNAPYAVPNNIYDIKSVRDRIFFGLTESISELKPHIAIFLEKKDELIDIIKKCKHLNHREKSDTAEYLESFFEDISVRMDNGVDLNAEL